MKMKQEQGITLISLIVTIIILLILSGISIGMLTGENGIVEKSNEAKKEMEKSKRIELSELYIQEINMKLAQDKQFLPDGIIEIEDIPIKMEEKQPNIGWIHKENDRITKYEFYFDDFYILNVNGNIEVEEFIFSELINIKEFGAVGDGKTDDTIAIQKAIEYLNNNGGTLYFPVGDYNVSVTNNGDSVINIQSDKKIDIDFFGSKIILKENSYPNYNIIKVNECTNANVRNGFLIGDRLSHDYNTINSTHEWGYGIFFVLTKNSTAYNMDISQMAGDAIVTKNGESGGKINIEQCNLHHCRRQGISVLDSDIIKISNTEIHHIGNFDKIKGTSPMSGIDLEPASGSLKINSVIMDNIKIHDTTSFGIVKGENILVDNIEILNSYIQNMSMQSLDIHNMINIKKSKIVYNDQTVFLTKVNFDNCNIELKGTGTVWLNNGIITNTTIEGKENISRYRFVADKYCKISNVKFKNIKGTGNYETNNITDFGILFSNNHVNNLEKITFENCGIHMNSGEIYGKESKFINCYIYTNTTLAMKDLEFLNCVTKANDGVTTISFYNCKSYDSGTFNGAIKKLYNCLFEFEDVIYYKDFPEGSICENSTIRIKNNMWKNALKLIKFSNQSKVILDKYNNINKIPNDYSKIDEDYTVEYKGNTIL